MQRDIRAGRLGRPRLTFLDVTDTERQRRRVTPQVPGRVGGSCKAWDFQRWRAGAFQPGPGAMPGRMFARVTNGPFAMTESPSSFRPFAASGSRSTSRWLPMALVWCVIAFCAQAFGALPAPYAEEGVMVDRQVLDAVRDGKARVLVEVRLAK